MTASSVFQQLIAPFQAGRFLDEHWEREPLFIAGESRAPSKVGLLAFDLAELKKAASRIDAQAEHTEYGTPALTSYHTDAVGPRSQRVTADQIDFLYAAGVSLSLTGLQQLHPKSAWLAARLQGELCHPGNVHLQAFLSPSGGGSPMHFDRSSLMSLQLEGSKRWRFSKAPAMDTPPGQTSLKARARFERAFPWARIAPPDPAAIEERTLNPGDVLYLPAGAWHEVTAAGHSLAVTIGFDRLPLHTLLARRLEELLVERTAWRKTPPPLFLDGGPATLEQFAQSCTERLGDLQRIIAEMAPEDIVACAYPGVVSADVADALPPVPGGASEPELRPEDVLVTPYPLHWSPGVDALGAYALLISSPYTTASISVEAFGLAENLVRTPIFKAADAIDWAVEPGGWSWEDVRDALEGLMAHGLVRRRPS